MSATTAEVTSLNNADGGQKDFFFPFFFTQLPKFEIKKSKTVQLDINKTFAYVSNQESKSITACINYKDKLLMHTIISSADAVRKHELW